MVAVLGAEEYPPIPDRWRAPLSRVDFAYVPREEFSARSFQATASQRYKEIDPEADASFLCDADTALLRSFPSPFLESLVDQPAIAGVMAHFPPPVYMDTRSEPDLEDLYPEMPPALFWERLGNAVLGRPPARPTRYSLPRGEDDHRAPFYPNHGFIAGTPELLLRLGRTIEEIRVCVENHLQSYFSAQISLALALEKANLPWRELPMRFNFPNDRLADETHPEELEHVCVLHYLRTAHFDRQRIFTSAECFDSFLGLDLEGSDRVFQRHVHEVTGGTYPFRDDLHAEGSSPRRPSPRLPGRDLADGGLPRTVVVCGARRTGTTLLASILSSDPEAPPYPGEMQLLARWLDTYRWVKEQFPFRGAPFFGNEEGLREYYTEALADLLGHCALRFAPATALVLKSPELSMYVPELVDLLPDAPVIVAARDPRDQVTSEWEILSRRRNPGDLRILAERSFADLAREYVRYYDAVLPELQRDPGRFCVLRYEDLVTSPEQTLGRLSEASGFDVRGFDPEGNWPRFGESFEAFTSAPSYTPLIGKAISRARVGAFREVLTDEEARQVLEICLPTASRLGYTPEDLD